MAGVSNDVAKLEPRTSLAGRELEFDLPAVRIGVAEYVEGPTGCTVFHFPEGALAAIDVRGGAPGTIMVSDFSYLDAICFAGGSLLGLEAATGVAAEIFAQRDYSTEFHRVPIVSGAIVYDFGRDTAVYPDKALGRAALRTARQGVFPLGARGAGACVFVGKGPRGDSAERAGQGAAFRQIGQAKVAAFSVVNAGGAIVNRAGSVVRGHFDRTSASRRHAMDSLEERLSDRSAGSTVPGNTTLTAVVTNQRISPRALQQLARQVHSSMARCIQPFHTMTDGDILYAVTTNEIAGSELDDAAIGLIASELVWDAVLTSFDPNGHTR